MINAETCVRSASSAMRSERAAAVESATISTMVQMWVAGMRGSNSAHRHRVPCRYKIPVRICVGPPQMAFDFSTPRGGWHVYACSAFSS
jgi:hypothetical protein